MADAGRRQDDSQENCRVCGEQLEYLVQSRHAVCHYCGRKEATNIICRNGHYVCNACHGRQVADLMLRRIWASDLQDPWAVAMQMFADEQLPMLGCEHALIAAGALLVSLRNSNRVAVTDAMLQEAMQRTERQALGGYCGLTGVCGVAVGIGAAFSVILEAACPKDKETRQTMLVVSRVVQRTAELTGPCCCKAFVLGALDVARAVCWEMWGIALPQGQVPVCQHALRHPHGCRGHLCPHHAG